MQEFRSRLEDLTEVEELKIRQEVAFGKYAALMPEEARQHPAKYNTELVEFLIEKYTQPGDVVADIMAGTGVLGVVAALRGRDVVQVELEPRYFEWMEKARESVEKLNTLTPKGRIINLLGDARKLTELLAEHVGAIITSPPFGDTNLSAGDPERRRERLLQAGHDPSDFLGGSARNAVLKHYGQADAVIVSPPYGDAVSNDKEGPLAGADIRRYGRWREGTARRHSYTQHLLPVKSSVDVDAVIMSPPYSNTNPFDKKDTEFWKRAHEMGNRWTPDPPKGVRNMELAQGNIGNLPLGPVDTIITPPPYERIRSHERHHTPNTGSAEKLLDEKQLGYYLAGSKDNIGNLSLGPVDAVITSPPYADTKKGKADVEKMAERWNRAFREHAETWNSWGTTSKTPGRLRAFKALGSGYSENANNIGNLSLGPVDAVITSPPFGEANRGGGIAVKGYEGKHGKDPELHLRHDRPLSDNPDNISNLAFGDAAQLGEPQVDLQQLYKKLLTKKGKPTYLSEMLLVYKNMYDVLKPGGAACVVVKPFVKDRKVVDLPYITWCLLRAVGFVLEKAYKWRIERPSFWRILYAKKNPDVPLVAHEYVVVVRKKAGGDV
jgi:16S rRNA G966 N2-methylase RsmD